MESKFPRLLQEAARLCLDLLSTSLNLPSATLEFFEYLFVLQGPDRCLFWAKPFYFPSLCVTDFEGNHCIALLGASATTCAAVLTSL